MIKIADPINLGNITLNIPINLGEEKDILEGDLSKIETLSKL